MTKALLTALTVGSITISTFAAGGHLLRDSARDFLVEARTRNVSARGARVWLEEKSIESDLLERFKSVSPTGINNTYLLTETNGQEGVVRRSWISEIDGAVGRQALHIPEVELRPSSTIMNRSDLVRTFDLPWGEVRRLDSFFLPAGSYRKMRSLLIDAPLLEIAVRRPPAGGVKLSVSKKGDLFTAILPDEPNSEIIGFDVSHDGTILKLDVKSGSSFYQKTYELKYRKEGHSRTIEPVLRKNRKYSNQEAKAFKVSEQIIPGVRQRAKEPVAGMQVEASATAEESVSAIGAGAK